MEKFDIMKRITEETLHKCCHLAIILPETYNRIFMDTGSKYDINLPEILARTVSRELEADTLKLDKITNETLENTTNLENIVDGISEKIETKQYSEILEYRQQLTDLKTKISDLKNTVFEDDLTKVYNKRWFMQDFLKQEEFFKKSVTFAFLDLNYFKDINDICGHIKGDKVLEVFAAKLKSVPETSVVRYGGDEFIIISETLDKQRMNAYLHKLTLFFDDRKIKSVLDKNHTWAVEKLSNSELFSFNEKGNAEIEVEFNLKFSYGVVSVDENESFISVMERADILMYEHKHRMKK